VAENSVAEFTYHINQKIIMKVLHIVPSAFDYFNDIRDFVFQLTDHLSDLEVESEIFTLQYGTTTRQTKIEIWQKSPGASFEGHIKINEIIASLDNFDIIHLHCPFLGAARRLLAWKKQNPDRKLIITYYRDIRLTDLFSFFILLYNNYYLPKIFKVADAISCLSAEDLKRTSAWRWMKDKKAIIELKSMADKSENQPNVHLTEDVNNIQLIPAAELAEACIRAYNKLLVK